MFSSVSPGPARQTIDRLARIHQVIDPAMIIRSTHQVNRARRKFHVYRFFIMGGFESIGEQWAETDHHQASDLPAGRPLEDQRQRIDPLSAPVPRAKRLANPNRIRGTENQDGKGGKG